MKEILIDIKDITDSRELYQSKPHPFVWIFTYILLSLLAGAILWASIGKIEIVVKATGQVRPESGISTVRNIFGGEIISVNYKQGQLVAKGDILFTIRHDHLVIEKESLENQLKTYQSELSNLQNYRLSIENHINQFDPMAEPVYFQKVNKLLLDLDSAINDSTYRKTKLQEELVFNQGRLSSQSREIVHIKEYIESLDSNTNKISKTDEEGKQYHQKFEEYLILRREYVRRYDQQELEIKASSNETMQITLTEEKVLLTAYKTLNDSILVGQSLFSMDDKYAGLYNDFVSKLSQLENTYKQAQSIYDAYLALEGYGVSKMEVESAKTQLIKTEGEYKGYQSNFINDLEKTIKDKEVNIIELENRISGSLNKDDLLKLNQEDRTNALAQIYLKERQAMYESEENIRDTISSLKMNIKLSEVELSTIDKNSAGETSDSFVTVERLKAQELVMTDEKIKSAEDTIKSLEQSIKKIDLDIQNAIVTANTDGVVNVIEEIYQGDYLASGKEILTIIPESNMAYTMQVVISNKDIGEVKVGDTVKYNFAALPSREYGEMRGTILSISEDAISNQSSGQSYYIVEATVPGMKLISSDGRQGDIKVGMICEASIITKQKTFLSFFLEKIDLLD